jgi:hypothetical protein
MVTLYLIVRHHSRRTPLFRHRDEKSITASPLEATLTRVLISVDYKRLTGQLNPLDATLTKKWGWGHITQAKCFPFSPLCLAPTRADVPSFRRLDDPPIFRTLFQVPYPLTPAFATLMRLLHPGRFCGTKTAGVYTNSAQFGTPLRSAMNKPSPISRYNWECRCKAAD